MWKWKFQILWFISEPGSFYNRRPYGQISHRTALWDSPLVNSPSRKCLQYYLHHYGLPQKDQRIHLIGQGPPCHREDPPSNASKSPTLPWIQLLSGQSGLSQHRKPLSKNQRARLLSEILPMVCWTILHPWSKTGNIKLQVRPTRNIPDISCLPCKTPQTSDAEWPPAILYTRTLMTWLNI